MVGVDGQIANLGEGLLSGSPSSLLTVRAQTAVWVESITLVNINDGQNQTCNIYLNRSGTRRRISPKDLTLRVGQVTELNAGYSLQAGQSIEGESSAPNTVEYTINGLETAQ